MKTKVDAHNRAGWLNGGKGETVAKLERFNEIRIQIERQAVAGVSSRNHKQLFAQIAPIVQKRKVVNSHSRNRRQQISGRMRTLRLQKNTDLEEEQRLGLFSFRFFNQ